ncbi:MAG TPA: hypothetical protein VN653_05530 [Anaerolineales bacterium]|nr:hypothetical protein [Anaerolineales bacterium]
MKTHYSPRSSDDEERAYCGVWLGEGSGLSGEWRLVDCLRCVRNKSKILRSFELEERAIIDQMGDMEKFMSSEAKDISI